MGVQEGGPTSRGIIEPYWMGLRRRLARSFPDWDSVQGLEVGFVLRIDGDISYWNKSGPDNVRFYKKQKEITLDLFMPRSAWDGAEGAQIESFLKDVTRRGFELVISRLRKENILTDEVEYRRRIDEALKGSLIQA
ncbi:hypothetical protein [Mesorhizobium sp. IMUNJ 23232]|uniref:hypothetical protein n=1 Tax=Mesorhizobium sp. IMUNJ 23232 TaxID=3376064 RepID=UPI00379481A7